MSRAKTKSRSSRRSKTFSAKRDLRPLLHLRFAPDAGADARDLASAALLEFDTAAVHEIGDAEWRVFFRDRADRERAAEALRALCDVTADEIEDQDWARRSQQDLKTIIVGRLVIAPPWDIPEHAIQGAPIVIEPSTGFGTGHHATTRLCLRALQALDLSGKRVLDVGTGSGVLAIAAARLGAAQVTAVDNDPDAIDAARANIQRNVVAVDLQRVDLQDTPLAPAQVVVANLTGAMLRRNAHVLAALAASGVLILSGLLDEEADEVTASFQCYGRLADQSSEEGWTALTVRVA